MFGLATAVPAQSISLTFNQEAEILFQKALARYLKGTYQKALLGFEELINKFPPNQRTSAARLMVSKTHFKLNSYDLAYTSAIDLQVKFPYSRYIPEADLIIGDCFFHQNQIYSAASQYARILSRKGDLRIKARVADRLGQIVGANYLSDRDVERLKSDFGQAIIGEAIAFGEARWLLYHGHSKKSTKKLALFLEQYPNGLLAPFSRQFLNQQSSKVLGPSKKSAPINQLSSEPTHARFTIGVIIPMNNPLGEDLRDGILLAREQHPLVSGETIKLIFEDSENNPIRTVKAAQRLIDQYKVIAIIGALTSSSTIPLASLLSSEKVPLLAPTASEDGIASLSPYIFQINATPGAQGRRLADYAIQKGGFRTLATLASRDHYGSQITREFTSRAEELGAEVIVQEWYEPGTTDYTGQFKRIREAALARHIPETFSIEVDSLLRSGIQVMPPPPIPVDPDTIQPEPINTLDGLLVAGDGEDILLIAPQVAFHQISAQILGSDGWNHPEVARDGGSYVEGVIFVAKYYDQSEIPSVQEFVNTYRSRFGKNQGIVSALGYDALLTILEGINSGATTRENLRDKLESLYEIPSATGKIVFNRGDRENAWMYLLTIRDRTIKPLLDEDIDKVIGKP